MLLVYIFSTYFKNFIMKCTCCEKEFQSFMLYSVHLRSNHRSATRFKCSDKCNRIFSNIKSHLKHIKICHFRADQLVSLNGNNNSDVINSKHESENLNFDIEPTSVSELSSHKELLKIILKVVRDDRTPRTSAFNTFKELFSFYDVGITNAISCLTASGCNNQELVFILKSLLCPSEIKSEYLLLKHLQIQKVLINYEIVDLGKEFYFAYANCNKIVKQKNDFFLCYS